MIGRSAMVGMALLLAAGAPCVQGEVILTGKTADPAQPPNTIIGDSIKDLDDSFLAVHIYRGYAHKIPKAAIAETKVIDRSQREELEEFDKRLKLLKSKDIAGHLELVEWAREKRLGVQAMGLLTGLQDRFPDDAKVRAAFRIPPQRKLLSEEDKAFFTEQVGTFFAAAGESNSVIATISERDALPPGTADEWARLCLAEARKGAKVTEGDTTFKRGTLENKLHIELWRKDKANTNDTPWPMVISLHGGGQGDGNWRSGGPGNFGAFRRHFDKLICVAPTVMHKRYAEWGANPAEEYQVREMLRAIKRTWNVDTDRVYMIGYSMGGYGTWHMGGHGADRFAGLVSGAGGILIGRDKGETWGWGIVANLMHTPIAFSHGGKDGPAPPWSDAECDRIFKELAAENPGSYRHNYRFFPDSGHGLPGSAVSEGVEWVAKFKRNPYPKRICWEPKRKFNRQFYWLWVDKPQIFTRLEGEIEGNTVKLETLNINGGFSVLLNRHLVDLDRPVTVLVNGKRVFEGLVPETLSTILATVADRIDERQWFSARIDF